LMKFDWLSANELRCIEVPGPSIYYGRCDAVRITASLLEAFPTVDSLRFENYSADARPVDSQLAPTLPLRFDQVRALSVQWTPIDNSRLFAFQHFRLLRSINLDASIIGYEANEALRSQ